FEDKGYWTYIQDVGSYNNVHGWLEGYDFNYDGIDDIIGNVYADDDASKCGVWFWQGKGDWNFTAGKRIGKGGRCWMGQGAVSPQMGHNLGFTFTVGESEAVDECKISTMDANDQIAFSLNIEPGTKKEYYLYYDDKYDNIPEYDSREVGIIAIDDYGGVYYLGSKQNGKFDDIMKISTLGDENYNVRGVAVADFDNDRDLDIITGKGTGEDQGKMYFFEQTSPGIFASPVYIGRVSTDMGWLMGVRAADFDNDGNYDFVAAGDRNNAIALFYGRGGGTFFDSYTSFTAIDAKFRPAMDVSDINNDGFADLALASSSGKIYIYVGYGKSQEGNEWDYVRLDPERDCGNNPYGLAV
ncbi:MAG: VCBS repeat-containing protein, partial [Candidatus Aenigmarchaeota archaeon]|nr:VCBS repeat-containing protein [Candidatus Aenigmarchaeota archaeon]